MNSKRIFLTLAALSALTLVGTNCTLVYSGCDNDSQCNTEAGEKCIKVSGTGECGLPSKFCEEGASMGCELAAYDPMEVAQLVDTNDRSTLTARGECANRMQVCNAQGEWIECRVPEICDGLDNDCNGQIDNGIPGVGDRCSAGVGVCERSGQTVCTSGGDIVCNAVAGTRTEPACDCFDNNCDQNVNDFDISLASSAADLPPAPFGEWSMTRLGDRRFAAVENATGGIDIIDMSAVAGSSVAVSLPDAVDPRLFASALNDKLVLFFVRDTLDEGGENSQAEVHFVTWSLNDGTLSEPYCIGCVDNMRGTKGGVIDYDVAFGGTDADRDSRVDPDDSACDAENASCAYLAAYIRSVDGALFTARIDVTKDVAADPENDIEASDGIKYAPNSEGILLQFASGNTNLKEVALRIAWPGNNAFLGLVRDAGSTHQIYLIQALSSNRVQLNKSAIVEPSFDPVTQDFELTVLPSGSVLLATTTSALPSASEEAPRTPGTVLTRYAISTTSTSFDAEFPEPVAIQPLAPESVATVANPRMTYLCVRSDGPEYAMIAYEVTDTTGGHAIEALIVDRATGNTVYRAQQSVPGAWPLLDRQGDDLLIGALISADGLTPVSPTAALTPTIDLVTCDP